MLQCIECPYNTKIKCNFDRHIKYKHKKESVNVINSYGNVVDSYGNLVDSYGNLVNSYENVVIPNPNVIIPHQCKKCHKKYSTKGNLTAHSSICKGIIKTLECEFCKKTYSNNQSKARHLLICKEKALIINNDNSITNNDKSITNNNTTNNDNSTTINDNSVTNNNTTIINLNLNKNNITPFITDHITDKRIIDLFKESGRDKKLFCSLFIDTIWSEKRNRCMIKTNMKNNFLQVLGIEDKWVNMFDKIAVCKYLVDICHTGTDLINQYTDKICKRIKKEYIDKNYQYLEDMTTCNIDDNEENINKNFVKNYKLLQLNAYNNSK